MSDLCKSFDDWLKEQNQPARNFLRRETYEAGQQSRQKEIDELKNRYENMENWYKFQLKTQGQNINQESADARKESNKLKGWLKTALKSYNAQKSLPMLDEFNRGWTSAFSCVVEDLEKLNK